MRPITELEGEVKMTVRLIKADGRVFEIPVEEVTVEIAEENK